MARWINYRDLDDQSMEIGRPLINPGARRHQRHAAQPDKPASPLLGKRVLIVRQPGEVIMRRCLDRASALAELEDMSRVAGYYVIREL